MYSPVVSELVSLGGRSFWFGTTGGLWRAFSRRQVRRVYVWADSLGMRRWSVPVGFLERRILMVWSLEYCGVWRNVNGHI